MDKFDLIVMRLRAGLKQFELAGLLRVPQTTICDLEKGRRPITPKIERQIRKALNKATKKITAASLVSENGTTTEGI